MQTARRLRGGASSETVCGIADVEKRFQSRAVVTPTVRSVQGCALVFESAQTTRKVHTVSVGWARPETLATSDRPKADCVDSAPLALAPRTARARMLPSISLRAATGTLKRRGTAPPQARTRAASGSQRALSPADPILPAPRRRTKQKRSRQAREALRRRTRPTGRRPRALSRSSSSRRNIGKYSALDREAFRERCHRIADEIRRVRARILGPKRHQPVRDRPTRHRCNAAHSWCRTNVD